MKKILYVAALMIATAFVSCGNNTEANYGAKDSTDTVVVDSVVDTTSVDSVVVDSVVVDLVK